MTVWFPSLPFARGIVADQPARARLRPAPPLGADPSRDLHAPDLDAAHRDSADLDGADLDGADLEAAGLDGAAPARHPGTWQVVAISAVLGAAMAAAAVYGARTYLGPAPAEALRLQQMAHVSADLGEAQQAMTQKLRTLETESVATADGVAALDARLKAQSAATATMQAGLAKLQAESSGGGRAALAVAALFGVAAVQLHDAVAAGRPFDWELVNVRGIVEPTPALLAALDRLAPLAATGVPTQAQLAEGLRTLAAIDAQRNAIPLVGGGIDLVGRMIGTSLLPLQRGPTPDLLTRASALLGDGDVAGSVRLMHALGGETAMVARPLVVAAEQRVAAMAAVQTLLDAARDGLRGQLKVAAVRQ